MGKGALLRLLTPLLSRRLLPIPLGVNLGGEGVLVAQGDVVDEEDPRGDENSRGLPEVKRHTEEAHGGAVVHGGIGDVEGEARDDVIHEDAEVVAKEGAGDAEGPGGGDDEDIASDNEGIGGELHGGSVEKRMGGLLAEGTLVEEIADEAEGEDGEGEEITGDLRVAAE